MGRHPEGVQLLAQALREGVEVGIGVPVGDDPDGEGSRVRQRAHAEGSLAIRGSSGNTSSTRAPA